MASETDCAWHSIYVYENANFVSAWKEHLQIAAVGDGRYMLRVFNPPTSEDDEPNWIEWACEEPVPAAGLHDALLDWAADRGINERGFAAATAAFKKHLAAEDAERVEVPR